MEYDTLISSCASDVEKKKHQKRPFDEKYIALISRGLPHRASTSDGAWDEIVCNITVRTKLTESMFKELSKSTAAALRTIEKPLENTLLMTTTHREEYLSVFENANDEKWGAFSTGSWRHELESSLHESGMERTGYKEKICSEKSGCERGCDHWSNFEMENDEYFITLSDFYPTGMANPSRNSFDLALEFQTLGKICKLMRPENCNVYSQLQSGEKKRTAGAIGDENTERDKVLDLHSLPHATESDIVHDSTNLPVPVESDEQKDIPHVEYFDAKMITAEPKWKRKLTKPHPRKIYSGKWLLLGANSTQNQNYVYTRFEQSQKHRRNYIFKDLMHRSWLDKGILEEKSKERSGIILGCFRSILDPTKFLGQVDVAAKLVQSSVNVEEANYYLSQKSSLIHKGGHPLFVPMRRFLIFGAKNIENNHQPAAHFLRDTVDTVEFIYKEILRGECEFYKIANVSGVRQQKMFVSGLIFTHALNSGASGLLERLSPPTGIRIDLRHSSHDDMSNFRFDVMR